VGACLAVGPLLLLALPSPLLGQSFRQAPTFSTGNLPDSIAAGDFNLDGNADLAIANGLSDDVSILMGDGAGGLAPAANHYAPGPVAVASEDFNGDDLSDLAVAGSSGTVSIWLGDGAGAFPAQTGVPIGGNPESMRTADFNNDGAVDLGVGLWDPVSSEYAVAILLGDGLGGFATPVNHQVGYGASSIAVADFDGDGNVDLAVTNLHSNTVSLLFGTGAGGFGPYATVTVGPVWAGPASVAAGDFNGDGWVDLATANSGSDDISVLRGNGAGGFLPPLKFVAGFGPSFIDVADVNGDAKLDLVVANRADTVSILLGDGAGGFDRTTADPAVGRRPVSLVITNLNGDAAADIAVVNGGDTDDTAADVSVLVGDGSGGFPAAAPALRLGDGPLGLAIGDFNADGRPDLAAANQGSADISVLLGAEGGGFGPTASVGVSGSTPDVAVGDFNGDGEEDLAAPKRFAGTVAVLLGNGQGGFGPPVEFAVGLFPLAAAVADFNEDTKADLAVVKSGGGVSILLGDGRGGFSTAGTYTSGIEPVAITVGDFNGDGKKDLAVADFGSDSVAILLGNGAGGFASPKSYAAGDLPHSAAVGDFNRDGKQDLVVANDNASSAAVPGATILLGDGSGGFGPPASHPAGDGSVSAEVGDFNGDGRQDVVVANAFSHELSILSGDGAGGFLPAVNLSVGFAPASVAVGDFDGDGKDDIAVAHNHPVGDVWVLLNTTVFQKADLAVAQDDGTTVAVPGSPLTYTITVTNHGPDAVSALQLKDTVPAALLAPVFTPVVGSYNPDSGAWTGLSLPAGHSVTLMLSGTVDPMAMGMLVNTATVATMVGVLDPNAGNDSATDTDTLAPAANLALAMTDSPDPVAAGGALTYILTATNLGTAQATGVTLTDDLDPAVDFVSVSPGPPACTVSAGTVTCALGTLDMGASTTVTIHATANRYTMATNTATVMANEGDPVAGNNIATASTLILFGSTGELTHGSLLWEDLAASPGPLAREGFFRLVREPRSSYEVIVDAASGDISGASGVLLQRVGADLATVLQDSEAVGVGFGRSLRVENASDQTIEDEAVRVGSAGCTVECGPDDVYRIRAYETTYTIPRFNNAGGQVTVLVLHNRGSDTVSGTLWFWSPVGALLASRGFTLAPHGSLVLDTTTVAGASGAAGSITVSNDGTYGIVEGKAVAFEPATGFTSDTPIEARTP